MINPEQQAQMDVFLGAKKKEGTDWFSQVQQNIQVEPEPAVEEETSFIDRATAPATERAKESVQAFKEGEQGVVSTAFQLGSTGIEAAVSPFIQGIKEVTPESVKKGLSAVGGAIATPFKGAAEALDFSDSEAVQKFAMSDLGKTTERNIESGLEYLAILPVGKGATVPAKGLSEFEKKAFQFAETQAARSEVKAEAKIAGQFEKGIRPSFTGTKKTVEGFKKYLTQARGAVMSIVKNKEILKFTDEFGETVSGKLPTSIKEFAEAVQTTKKSIFEKYSSLAERATAQKVTVPMAKIADELDTISTSPALKGFRPEVVAYAEARSKSLREMAELSPNDVQEAIKIMNQSLDAFYRSPSFDSASKAWIDSLIVNNLRKGLDDVISKATGAEYQALKSEYGALRAIEKDVTHRALVDARKNAKGLLDFTDVLSGGEVVSGLVSMNPALIAKGAVQKSISSYFKALNDPNNIIKKMFIGAEKLQGKK